MAVATCALGQHVLAAHLCSAAERIREQEHAPRPPAEQHQYDRVLAAARTALGNERFEQVWSTGRMLSLDDAISYALTKSPER